MRWRAFTWLCATLPAALALLASAPPSEAASFAACPAEPGFDCASVPVPLDRSGALPGSISLSVERHTAGAAPARSAIIPLAGGPGQAVLPLGRFIAEAIAPGLAGRDLLLFDQRGTGASGPLSCPALTGAESTPAQSGAELVQRCARQLGPARADYTTLESVADIEAVRRAAGYQKVVLYGTSYGTKVALEYAQRYPQNVEALVLDSVEVPEGPEPFHVSTFQAIRPALAELCSQRACAHIAANPLGDLAHLVAATRSRPLIGHAFDGRGRRVRVTLGTFDLLDLLVGSDLNPAERALLPGALHAAARHDLAPLARLKALAATHPAREEPSSEVDSTLYLDTSCEETPFPWQRGASEAIRGVEAEAAVSALPGSDFYPFNAGTALAFPPLSICVSWPDAAAAPPGAGPLPDVPTLILSGGQDLRTPTADARRVAAMIPGAQLVKVPYTGHSVIGSDFSGCARAALAAFFAGSGGASGPCGTAQNRFPPAPLPPQGLSAVRPAAHTSGLPGRTLAAALGSVRDLRRAVIDLTLGFGALPAGVGFGGLRGGSAQMTSAGARLHGYTYVPGVQLSGFVPMGLLLKDEGPGARLQVRGAAAGRLVLATGGRVSGELGGRRISLRVPASLARAAEGTPTRFPSPELAGIK